MKPSVIPDHPFGEAYAKRLGAAVWRGALPGPKVEEWRFTPLRALAKIPFVPAAQAEDVDVTEVPRAVPVIAGAARIVLVNGAYRADLSDKDFGAGVTVSAQACAGPVPSPLASLNTAYMTGGVTIQAKAGAAKIVHLVSIGAAGAEPAAFHPRVIISAETGTSVTVIESHVGLPGQIYFSNPVTEIAVAANATVRRYVSVAEDGDAFHLATTAVTVAGGGSFEAFHLGLGGALVRQEISVAFEGQGASAKVNGAYALTDHAHHDFTTFMDHRVPACTSNQIFKGVVDGQSHGIYQGRILVARGAQKTDARQVHKALFLARGPQVDCKPELEIYADDVQCAHGAATGELDPDHLYYLAARGIDPETARNLLVEGFLADAVSEIEDETARDLFGAAIGAWLKKREAMRS
jgi:Fe-S cluster assembly protein SufD